MPNSIAAQAKALLCDDTRTFADMSGIERLILIASGKTLPVCDALNFYLVATEAIQEFRDLEMAASAYADENRRQRAAYDRLFEKSLELERQLATENQRLQSALSDAAWAAELYGVPSDSYT